MFSYDSQCLERWLSGLRQRFTKPPFSQENRGFESHSLRRENYAQVPNDLKSIQV